jgi:hypothetical protein
MRGSRHTWMSFGDENRYNNKPVVIAGGLDSRLWPLSRAAFPKQY